MRITEKMLDSLVNRLNEETNSPLTPYTKDAKANIGNYHIDQAYGGYRLDRMANDWGGINVISENGYTKKADLYTQIQMMLKGRSI